MAGECRVIGGWPGHTGQGALPMGTLRHTCLQLRASPGLSGPGRRRLSSHNRGEDLFRSIIFKQLFKGRIKVSREHPGSSLLSKPGSQQPHCTQRTPLGLCTELMLISKLLLPGLLLHLLLGPWHNWEASGLAPLGRVPKVLQDHHMYAHRLLACMGPLSFQHRQLNLLAQANCVGRTTIFWAVHGNLVVKCSKRSSKYKQMYLSCISMLHGSRGRGLWEAGTASALLPTLPPLPGTEPGRQGTLSRHLLKEKTDVSIQSTTTG